MFFPGWITNKIVEIIASLNLSKMANLQYPKNPKTRVNMEFGPMRTIAKWKHSWDIFLFANIYIHGNHWPIIEHTSQIIYTRVN